MNQFNREGYSHDKSGRHVKGSSSLLDSHFDPYFLHQASQSTVTAESHSKSKSVGDRMPLYDASMIPGSEMFNFSAEAELLSFQSKNLSSQQSASSEDAVSCRPVAAGPFTSFGQTVSKDSVVSNVTSWKNYSAQGSEEWPGRVILNSVGYEGGQDSLATPLMLGGSVKEVAAQADAMRLYLMNPGYDAYSEASTAAHSSNNIANQIHDVHKQIVEVPAHFQSYIQNHAVSVVGETSHSSGSQWVSGTNELALLPSYSDIQNGHYLPSSRYYGIGSWANRHNALQDSYQGAFVEGKVGVEVRPQQLSIGRDGCGPSGQGLSLSLSPHQPSEVPLHQIDAVCNRTNILQLSADHLKGKSEDVQSRNDGAHGPQGHLSPYSRRVLSRVGAPMDLQMNVGPLGPFTGYATILKGSKYLKPAQQLLEEFCNVGKGLNYQCNPSKQKLLGHHLSAEKSLTDAVIPPTSTSVKGEVDGRKASACAASSSMSIVDKTSSEPAMGEQLVISGARFEMHKKRTRLLALLDELQRRYRQYNDQMQMIITSFESVGGLGAAAPYTSLALKAMSRHFKCLKDAIGDQLKVISKALGDESSLPGLSVGETPRLRLVDQNNRNQRSVHHLGMLEQHAWRPQRGLPERAVSVLRAWLFEHFLHPYPTDADKHMLARQTGLSRSQVSNWFINARVRLWKPMVEEMYELETREASQVDAPSGKTDREERDTSKGASSTDKNAPGRGKVIMETISEMQSVSGCGSSSKLEQTTSTSQNGHENCGTSVSIPLESSYLHAHEADAARETAVNVNRHFSGQTQGMPTSHTAISGVESGSGYADSSSFSYEQATKRLRQGLGNTIDFSSYMGGRISQESLNPRPTGNASVSLTLGLRHSGAQEKYTGALYLPREDTLQGCNSRYEIHEIHDGHNQAYAGGFETHDIQFRKHLIGTQLLQ